MSMLIIADDLSGAADCAIGFARSGLHTVVALDPGQGTDDAEVVAVDTDSRRMAASEAAQRTLAAFEVLSGPHQRLYKKIDSTLRGNWAAEVAALQPLAGLAIVAPAFPETGRTVLAGRVWVNGVALEDTDTWRLENAGRPADLATLLAEAGLSAGHLGLDELRGDPRAAVSSIVQARVQGAKALIVDAQNTDDLQALARLSAQLDFPVFWVGSGGLARELCPVPGPTVAPATDAAPAGGALASTLVLVGSLSSVAERQCVELKRRSGIVELVVPPAVLRVGPQSREWADWAWRIGQYLTEGTDLLLRIGRDLYVDPSEGAQLSARLALLVKPHYAWLGGLVVTGGETARAMLGAVGIGGLRIIEELEAGTVLARPLDTTDHPGPRVVTKAGAFGSPQALYLAWRHLSGRAHTSIESR
ncbi:hypothetical protein D3C76_578130 [compost metagenome]